MRRVILFFIIFILVAISISGCLGEETIITTPAIEMILHEDDFDNNLTSWWVIEIENASIPPLDAAYAGLTHYSHYPIDEEYRDLECGIMLFVYGSIENATEIFHEVANSPNSTSCSIGEEGLYIIPGPEEDVVLYVFRISNVIVWMNLQLIGEDTDPMDERILGLVELQESKIT